MNLEQANVIRQQIGNGALYMIGAKSFSYTEEYFSFRIRGSKKVNYIRIYLNEKDLYDIEYGKIRGMNYKKVSNITDVYFDQLRDSIEENTGLITCF